MMLLLTASALAMDVQGHAGVSAGTQVIPALADVLGPNVAFARAEIGLGSPRAQGYLVTQMALHDAAPWWEQAGRGAPFVVAGDVLFAQIGVGARLPLDVWVLRLVPHLDVGITHGSSPIEAAAYEEDVLPELGSIPSVGRSAMGAWAQIGGDVGIPVIVDAVDLHLSADAGYIALHGVGLTLDARVGLAARF